MKVSLLTVCHKKNSVFGCFKEHRIQIEKFIWLLGIQVIGSLECVKIQTTTTNQQIEEYCLCRKVEVNCTIHKTLIIFKVYISLKNVVAK